MCLASCWHSVGTSTCAIKSSDTLAQFALKLTAPGHSVFMCTWDHSSLHRARAAPGWQQAQGSDPGSGSWCRVIEGLSGA